ncbi:MAG TPA: DNA methyltransferase, partial [Myxococcus sp.]|nr:DNA methyltransferase [Myxococcus sp.]
MTSTPSPDTLRCHNADAREPDGYRAALGATRASLLLTDPPYCLLTRRRKGGDLRDPRAHKKIDQNPIVRFETVRDYRAFSDAWLSRAVAHLTPDAPLVIWTNLLGKEPILSAARALGYPHLRGEYTWGKRTTDKNANEQTLRVYEVALVIARAPAPPLAPGDLPTVWAVVGGYDDDGAAARWGSHPHHKPFSVLEPLVRTYSRPGDTVLDPFAGSGSMPASALRLGRLPACMEIEP